MNENRSHFTLYGKSPFLQLGVALIIAMFIGGVFSLFFYIAVFLFSGIDLRTLLDEVLTNIGAKDIMFFRFLLIIQSISFLLIPAILMRNLLLPENQRSFNDFHKPKFKEIILVALLVFCILPVNGITGGINEAMKLPDWLSGLENWMKAKEDLAAKLVGLIVSSDRAGILFLNLFVVAIIPAISEELFFRGVLQRIFYGFFRSPHPAIWLIAVFFSATHLQFYGFVPRLILGLSFGYLYYWSRTLWLPMIAHFLNNATSVVIEYYNGTDTNISVGKAEGWANLLVLSVFVFLCVIILLYFRNKFNLEQIPVSNITKSDNYDQV